MNDVIVLFCHHDTYTFYFGDPFRESEQIKFLRRNCFIDLFVFDFINNLIFAYSDNDINFHNQVCIRESYFISLVLWLIRLCFLLENLDKHIIQFSIN